ncbi:hypothetical protein K2P56_00040 [Patescibacteria group bacterium]|nr:hypothetical protein [Patescibacteria group bacterium]
MIFGIALIAFAAFLAYKEKFEIIPGTVISGASLKVFALAEAVAGFYFIYPGFFPLPQTAEVGLAVLVFVNLCAAAAMYFSNTDVRENPPQNYTPFFLRKSFHISLLENGAITASVMCALVGSFFVMVVQGPTTEWKYLMLGLAVLYVVGIFVVAKKIAKRQSYIQSAVVLVFALLPACLFFAFT